MKPRLAIGTRLRNDPRDGTRVLLSPERGLRLGETTAAIVDLFDGMRTVDEIVDVLAARYGADSRARIDADVRALLSVLYARGLLYDFDGSEKTGRPEALSELAGPSLSEPSSPYTLVAELTHRCLLRCPYCSNPRELVRADQELTTDEWVRVIDEAAALGVMQLHLSGGEPLARSDLEVIVVRARERELYVNLVTSGVPLRRARLERLAPSLDHVQLSIQDAEKAGSDCVAGLESFEQKLSVASWVKGLGLPLTVNVVLHRNNIDRVEDVVAMAERLGADRLELANVQWVSWALENRAALMPSQSQIELARAVAADAKERLTGRMQVVFV